MTLYERDPLSDQEFSHYACVIYLQDYTENFTTHGYNNLHFIASMTPEVTQYITILYFYCTTYLQYIGL